MTEQKIDCIGKDNKRHTCNPAATKASCGVEIKRKKLLKNDIALHFACYECTF